MPDTQNPVMTEAVPGIAGMTSAGPTTPAAGIDERTKALLAALARASQQKQFAGHPTASPIPGQQDPNAARQIGMNTANPHAWGAQRMMAQIQTSIQNAVSQHKEKQLTKATADWEYLQSSLNELYAAQASGDPNAVAAAQKKVDVTLGDPKKMKEMAKALNQDWLNPEKTTVYGEALKKAQAKKQQDDTKKGEAATGLKGIFQKLMQRRQQPQLSPEDQQSMSREVQAKAPTTTPGVNVKDQVEAAKGILDIEKASKEARENYFPPVADEHGVLRSVNKANPRDVVTIKDAETGQEVKGIPKGGNPKVLANGGVPYGIARNGKIVTPDNPDWSKEDQMAFDGAMGAAKEKQQLRIDPIIADQLGAPPDPKDYAKGRKDPEYAKALAEYGRGAEGIKDRMAAASGAARAKAFNEYRPVQVMDENGDVYYTTAKDAISQKLAGAGEGVKLRPREAQIKDIQVASGKAREAINGLDRGFDATQVAKLHLALTTPDDTIANAEFTTLATQNLTDKQQDFVVWIKQLNERAMSLRNVAGMGTGAQDLRNAIRDMLPGVRSGNTKMMNKQLDAFDNQVAILKGGIAHPGKSDMETQSHNGATYQRKKGSNDPWTLAPKTN